MKILKPYIGLYRTVTSIECVSSGKSRCLAKGIIRVAPFYHVSYSLLYKKYQYAIVQTFWVKINITITTFYNIKRNLAKVSSHWLTAWLLN